METQELSILFTKKQKDGFNGKFGFTTGVGSLWVQKENLPTIRPQYTFTPKINPSVSLNYRKTKSMSFFKAITYIQKRLTKMNL
ncbi:TonB-dependent receptor [Flavobacterium psychrophilum]|nr:TonB-dependent receptor [Flavobacterium psychrophilum]